MGNVSAIVPRANAAPPVEMVNFFEDMSISIFVFCAAHVMVGLAGGFQFPVLVQRHQALFSLGALCV